MRMRGTVARGGKSTQSLFLPSLGGQGCFPESMTSGQTRKIITVIKESGLKADRCSRQEEWHCQGRHYPKQSFTTVADTPENLRLKQQSELQSQVKYKRDFEESKGRGFSIVTDTPELQRLKRTQEQISNVKYHEDFEKTKGRGFTPIVDDPVMERARKNTQVVSDAAYKGVQPHVVEMDRRPGIIVAPVLPGAYQQSHSQGYGYMHQTSVSSMRSMQHSPNLRTYRAMYDYSAQDEDEVSFRDGDYIVNVQPIDDGWMYGTVQRTGRTGMLPANYIEFVN